MQGGMQQPGQFASNAGDLLDPTGNSMALQVAGPKQDEMGFPRPQFAGAKEPSGNAIPGSSGPDMSQPSANDDPFAGPSPLLSASQPPQHAQKPSIGQMPPMAMDAPQQQVPQQAPPFNMQEMNAIL